MASRVTSTRLIGRSAELLELTAALDEAADGRPSLAFVAGDSGVGKTRLMQELSALAKERGARVEAGDCVELGEDELPYAPIVGALRPLVPNTIGIMRVAFLGLGIMGSRMAVHLVGAGHKLSLWTRTAGKAETWSTRNGGSAFATPAQAAAGADVVISMVVDGPQVQEILLGPGGAASGAPAGTLFADMSTIAPQAAISIASSLAEGGHRFIDAPVTGSSPAADAGTLTIMTGGESGDVDQAQPLLEAMGRTIVRCGPVGHGQLVKLLNNAVAVANAVTAAQALVAGRALGADLDALVSVLRAGSGGSAVLDLKAAPFLAHDYTTLFKTAHMLKDVNHCLDAVSAAGASFPAAADAAEILAAAVSRGHGDDDYASILEVVEGREGVRI